MNTLQKMSSQIGQDIIYILFFETVQYSATKKVKEPIKKPIINYCLAKITSIIDRLLAAVGKKHNV